MPPQGDSRPIREVHNNMKQQPSLAANSSLTRKRLQRHQPPRSGRARQVPPRPQTHPSSSVAGPCSRACPPRPWHTRPPPIACTAGAQQPAEGTRRAPVARSRLAWSRRTHTLPRRRSCRRSQNPPLRRCAAALPRPATPPSLRPPRELQRNRGRRVLRVASAPCLPEIRANRSCPPRTSAPRRRSRAAWRAAQAAAAAGTGRSSEGRGAGEWQRRAPWPTAPR